MVHVPKFMLHMTAQGRLYFRQGGNFICGCCFLLCGGTGTVMQLLASLYSPFTFLAAAPVSRLS